MTFAATIRSGKLFLDKPEQFKQHLYTFPNEKRVEVTVEKITHSRSNTQNRYYWGVVVKEIAQHTGHDPEQIHELLKFRFSPRSEMNLSATESATNIPTSTTRLDTLAFVFVFT
jgi:hypothetical protein